jgi:hypothetical protein
VPIIEVDHFRNFKHSLDPSGTVIRTKTRHYYGRFSRTSPIPHQRMKRLIGLVLATTRQKKIVPILFNFHEVEIGAILTTLWKKNESQDRCQGKSNLPKLQRYAQVRPRLLLQKDHLRICAPEFLIFACISGLNFFTSSALYEPVGMSLMVGSFVGLCLVITSQVPTICSVAIA